MRLFIQWPNTWPTTSLYGSLCYHRGILINSLNSATVSNYLTKINKHFLFFFFFNILFSTLMMIRPNIYSLESTLQALNMPPDTSLSLLRSKLKCAHVYPDWCANGSCVGTTHVAYTETRLWLSCISGWLVTHSNYGSLHCWHETFMKFCWFYSLMTSVCLYVLYILQQRWQKSDLKIE